MGYQMGIEIVLALIGSALVATALARMAYERRLDRKSAGAALDRFRSLEGSRQYQLDLTFAC
jgi:hypothetical protein